MLSAAAWDAMTAYLAARAIPGVEEVRDGVYRRTAVVGAAKRAIDATAGIIS